MKGPSVDQAPIAVALDAPDIATMRDWAGAVAGSVACLKVGLEVFCRDGHRAVSAVREAGPTRATRKSMSSWI